MRSLKLLAVVGLVVILAATLVVPVQGQGCPAGAAQHVELPWFPSDIYVIADPGNSTLDALANRVMRFSPNQVFRAQSVKEIIDVVNDVVKKQGRPVSVTIGAHGDSGGFLIGKQVVGFNNDNETLLIKGLKGRINTLYFIVCSIAKGPEGRDFLQRLADGIAAGKPVAVEGPEDHVDVVIKNNEALRLLIANVGNCTKSNCLYTAASRVPTLTEWGLIALALLLAGSLAFMIRRRLAPRPAGA